MSGTRVYALTVAGFDPSGGAGLLADIKTFEQQKVYGLAVNTGNTIQTEHRFYSMQWSPLSEILETLRVLLDAYPVKAMKTGIVPDMNSLYDIIILARKLSPEIQIVVDPVIRSSTDFDFQVPASRESVNAVLELCSLITPNIREAIALTGISNATEAAEALSARCPVLLKGGHHETQKGVDYLYDQGQVHILRPAGTDAYAKHGSGCVLSAAITAALAQGMPLREACISGKRYIEAFLNSHSSLLGTHDV